jgi:hypothetical protein
LYQLLDQSTSISFHVPSNVTKLFQFKVVTKKKKHFAVDLHEAFYYCVYVHILTSSSVPWVLVSGKQNFLIF